MRFAPSSAEILDPPLQHATQGYRDGPTLLLSVQYKALYQALKPRIPQPFPRVNYRKRSCGKVMFSQACVKNSARHPPGQTLPGQTLPPAVGYCSGRYASYWNAFLFMLIILPFCRDGEVGSKLQKSLD